MTGAERLELNFPESLPLGSLPLESICFSSRILKMSQDETMSDGGNHTGRSHHHTMVERGRTRGTSSTHPRPKALGTDLAQSIPCRRMCSINWKFVLLLDQTAATTKKSNAPVPEQRRRGVGVERHTDVWGLGKHWETQTQKQIQPGIKESPWGAEVQGPVGTWELGSALWAPSRKFSSSDLCAALSTPSAFTDSCNVWNL